MKNSVLIAIHYMELGGAEMSLLGLLESLDYSETEVDLFVYSHRGELMRWIPGQVNLLPEIPQYKQIERPITDVLKEGFFRIAMARIKAKFLYSRYESRLFFSWLSRDQAHNYEGPGNSRRCHTLCRD